MILLDNGINSHFLGGKSRETCSFSQGIGYRFIFLFIRNTEMSVVFSREPG